MKRLAISETTTYRWAFDEDIVHYHRAGVQSVGVWREKLADFGEERGVELLRDMEMDVSSLWWVGGFTGSDGRTHVGSVRDAQRAMRLAADIRAECVIAYPGGQGGHIRRHAERLLNGALDELIFFAEEFNIPIAFEPMPGCCAGNWTFWDDYRQGVDFILSSESEYVQMVLDVDHFHHSGLSLDQLKEMVPRIALVQLADSQCAPGAEVNRCALGEGEIPLAEIMAALEEAGYNGRYEVELFGEDVESYDYEWLLAHCTSAVEALFSRMTAPMQ